MIRNLLRIYNKFRKCTLFIKKNSGNEYSYYNFTTIPKNISYRCSFVTQKGHAESIRTLGVCYSEGLGVEQSFEKAFELYQKAAELGLVDA